MSVKGSKRGKSSHEQRPVRGSAGGMLFVKAMKGITPVRGAAGGMLFLKPKSSTSPKLPTPGFEHKPRGASVTRTSTRGAGTPRARKTGGRTIIESGK